MITEQEARALAHRKWPDVSPDEFSVEEFTHCFVLGSPTEFDPDVIGGSQLLVDKHDGSAHGMPPLGGYYARKYERDRYGAPEGVVDADHALRLLSARNPFLRPEDVELVECERTFVVWPPAPPVHGSSAPIVVVVDRVDGSVHGVWGDCGSPEAADRLYASGLGRTRWG